MICFHTIKNKSYGSAIKYIIYIYGLTRKKKHFKCISTNKIYNSQRDVYFKLYNYFRI